MESADDWEKALAKQRSRRVQTQPRSLLPPGGLGVSPALDCRLSGTARGSLVFPGGTGMVTEPLSPTDPPALPLLWAGRCEGWQQTPSSRGTGHVPRAVSQLRPHTGPRGRRGVPPPRNPSEPCWYMRRLLPSTRNTPLCSPRRNACAARRKFSPTCCRCSVMLGASPARSGWQRRAGCRRWSPAAD